MGMQQKAFINSTGVVRLAHSRTSGSGGWLMMFVPSSDWNGLIVLKKNTAAPSTIPQTPRSGDLTTTAYYDNIQNTPAQGGMTTVTAGTPLSGGSRTLIIPLPDYSVWADATVNAGSMAVTVLSYDAPLVLTAANLSQLTIDAVPIAYPDDLAFQLQLAGTQAGTL